MAKDRLFDRKVPVGDFTFNKKIANVFDDMLNRSVPLYGEVQRMLIELAVNFIQPKTNVYDLGCSTGTTLIRLSNYLKEMGQRSINLVGLDSSSAMLAKTRENLRKNKVTNYILYRHDLNECFKFKNASCVFLNWTLQFVRPVSRPMLLKSIYDGLNREGVLLLMEKIIGKDSMLARLYIDLYHNFKKRQGYSDLEIMKKREALENVLVPYRLDEDCELLERAGFSKVDIFFKWYNFAGFIAVKY